MLAIIFRSDELEFSISASFIQEITRMVKIDYFPTETGKIDSVINYRGKNIPVMDICKYLGKKRRPYTKENIIVVLNYQGQEIAILTDDVLDKLEIETNDIKAFDNLTNDYFPAFFNINEKIIPLLNMKKVAYDLKKDAENLTLAS
ncbi:MAG: chemotaxis protein CheW [Candidatus Sericytochromatia bacterium]